MEQINKTRVFLEALCFRKAIPRELPELQELKNCILVNADQSKGLYGFCNKHFQLFQRTNSNKSIQINLVSTKRAL